MPKEQSCQIIEGPEKAYTHQCELPDVKGVKPNVGDTLDLNSMERIWYRNNEANHTYPHTVDTLFQCECGKWYVTVHHASSLFTMYWVRCYWYKVLILKRRARKAGRL